MKASEAVTLRHFAWTEFRHPELVSFQAAQFLDNVREWYGKPIILTSDARTPEENAAAAGSSPTSLHLSGRAFDMQLPVLSDSLWAFVGAVYAAQHVYGGPIELELVKGPTDRHAHIALLPLGRPSRLVLALD